MEEKLATSFIKWARRRRNRRQVVRSFDIGLALFGCGECVGSHTQPTKIATRFDELRPGAEALWLARALLG
jgi:hypothetical protein